MFDILSETTQQQFSN